MKKLAYVKLTLHPNGRPVYVEHRQITAIQGMSHGGSVIADDWEVRESPEQVIANLNDMYAKAAGAEHSTERGIL